MLIEQIKTDRDQARKEKWVTVGTTLTTLLGELETQAKRTGEKISDTLVLSVIRKFLKNIEETLALKDCDNLRIEKLVLEAYLPQQLTKDQIQGILSQGSFNNMGEFMSYMKENYAGLYDGKLCSTLFKEYFNGP